MSRFKTSFLTLTFVALLEGFLSQCCFASCANSDSPSATGCAVLGTDWLFFGWDPALFFCLLAVGMVTCDAWGCGRVVVHQYAPNDPREISLMRPELQPCLRAYLRRPRQRSSGRFCRLSSEAIPPCFWSPCPFSPHYLSTFHTGFFKSTSLHTTRRNPARAFESFDKSFSIK